MRTLAVGYVVFLLCLVALADVGVLGGLVRELHALPAADKVAHFLFAVGLGALLEASSVPRRRVALVAVPLIVLEEVSQRFVPGRTFDLGDLAADLGGLAVGAMGVWAAHTWTDRRRAARRTQHADSACPPRERCDTSYGP